MLRDRIGGRASRRRVDVPGTMSAATKSELRQMWLALMREPWTSMAVVPSDRGVPLESVMGVAAELADLNQCHVAEARGLSVADSVKLNQKIEQVVVGGSRAIVAVDPLTESLAAITIATQASCALVVVKLGVSQMDSVKTAAAIVGPARLAGTVVIG